MDSGSLAKSNAVVVRSPRMPSVETARTSTITHAETVRHGRLALGRASAEVERDRDTWRLPPGSGERHAEAVRGYGGGKNDRGPGSRNRCGMELAWSRPPFRYRWPIEHSCTVTYTCRVPVLRRRYIRDERTITSPVATWFAAWLMDPSGASPGSDLCAQAICQRHHHASWTTGPHRPEVGIAAHPTGGYTGTIAPPGHRRPGHQRLLQRRRQRRHICDMMRSVRPRNDVAPCQEDLSMNRRSFLTLMLSATLGAAATPARAQRGDMIHFAEFDGLERVIARSWLAPMALPEDEASPVP